MDSLQNISQVSSSFVYCLSMLFYFSYRNAIELSRDVSYCERIDANTLLHGDGSIYVLSGMPDHFTSKWDT
jgi:hypothetical protein